jgi:hypothetical protein
LKINDPIPLCGKPDVVWETRDGTLLEITKVVRINKYMNLRLFSYLYISYWLKQHKKGLLLIMVLFILKIEI